MSFELFCEFAFEFLYSQLKKSWVLTYVCNEKKNICENFFSFWDIWSIFMIQKSIFMINAPRISTKYDFFDQIKHVYDELGRI